MDGTQIRANASKHKNVRYDRAGQLERKLLTDVEELLRQAESQDRRDEVDGQKLPKEIARRERLREKMLEARRRLEERARTEESEQGSSDDSDEKGPKGGGKAVRGQPEARKQINLTDADSALMRKSRRDSYQQVYNAQAVVDAEGSQLVLGTDVLMTPSDANELERAIATVPEDVGTVKRVLADGGYVNADAIERIQKRGIEAYVAISDQEQNIRRYDYRPPRERKPKTVKDSRLVAMREKLRTEEGRRIYAKRAQTVETVFGIIKAPMGFRQFLLRGHAKVCIEWYLVCLSYNMKRLFSLATA